MDQGGTVLSAVYRDNLTGVLRRVLVVALVSALPTVTWMYVASGGEEPLVRYGYPPLLVYLGAYLWVLLRRPGHVLNFSRATLVLFQGGWIAAMALRLGTAADVAEAWRALFPTFFMGMVVFLVVTFLVHGSRAALVSSGAVILGLLLTGTTVLWTIGADEQYVRDLARYAVFLATTALLLHVLSQAKARLALAVAEAARATDEAHQMRDMAYRDPLTGVANRRRLVEELTYQAARPDRERPVAVVYFDLDHFKRINDEHGHAVGDDVLCVLADSTGQVVRDGDLVARIGGEEFVVVSPGTAPHDAVRLAERLRGVVRDQVSRVTGVPVTASFGVDEVRPGEEPEEVLARVDALMYAAKSDGRDRVRTGP